MEFILPEELPVEAAAETRKRCPCGRMFTPYRPYQRYHNKACRAKFEAKRPSRYKPRPYVTKICPWCKGEFKTNNKRKVYCCDQCYNDFDAARHSKPVVRVCPSCLRSFTTTHWSKKYCDEICRRDARGAR